MTIADVLIRSSQPSERVVERLRPVLSNLSRDRAFVRVTTLREASTGPLERITRMALIIAALVLSLATVGLVRLHLVRHLPAHQGDCDPDGRRRAGARGAATGRP